MSIKQWLSDHCQLAQYTPIFIENGFENTILFANIRDMADLEEIRISKLGHKLEIFKQIENLKNNIQKHIVSPILPITIICKK